MNNRYMTRLTAKLAADGIPDSRSQSITLAAVWDDLCPLAGETILPIILGRSRMTARNQTWCYLCTTYASRPTRCP